MSSGSIDLENMWLVHMNMYIASIHATLTLGPQNKYAFLASIIKVG
jgi:hypothetical protein